MSVVVNLVTFELPLQIVCVVKYNSSGGGGLKEAVAMFSPAV